MTRAEATAEVFLTALKALPKTQRDQVILRISQDEDFAEYLQDLAIIASRKGEPSRPLDDYLKERKRRRSS